MSGRSIVAVHRSALHIVTGATGLIGSAIALELLRSDPSTRVLAVVRALDLGADERLQQTLRRAARLHGLGDTLDAAIGERCEAVAGDIHRPRCGVEPSIDWAGAQMWHCAAALQFQDRYRDEVVQTNVEGTRHALELAKALEARSFDLMSTAYVAGTRTGLILEEPVDSVEELDANNHYERSKARSENLARDSGLRVRILRPGIVIGHSGTHGALTYNGLYGFMRGVFKFRRLMERTQSGLMSSLEVRLRADAHGCLDFVPVDFVARDAVALSRVDAEPGVYHLASVARPKIRRTLEIIFESVGLRPPVFVEDVEELTWLDRKLDRFISVYNAYLLGDKRFDRSRTDRWLPEPAGRGYALPDAELRRFCDWYLEEELAPRTSATTT